MGVVEDPMVLGDDPACIVVDSVGVVADPAGQAVSIYTEFIQSQQRSA